MKSRNLAVSVMFGLMLLAGALSASDIDKTDIPSCYAIQFLPLVNFYEFIDGVDNDNLTADGTFNYSTSVFNATIQARLGISGSDTMLFGVHLQNLTTGVRGAAYVWRRLDGTYYALFQQDKYAYAIPFLTPRVFAGNTYYSNSFGDVIWFNTTHFYASLGWGYAAGLVTYYRAAVFSLGAEDFYGFGHCGVVGCDVNYNFDLTVTHNGFVTSGQSGGTLCGAHSGFMMTLSSSIVNNPALAVALDDQMDADICTSHLNYTLRPTYYGCVESLGNVTFTAFEGSDNCTSGGYIPEIACTLEATSVTIPASGTTVTTNYSGFPSFSEILHVTPSCDAVNQAEDTAYYSPSSSILLLLLSKSDNPALWFYAKHWEISGDPYIEACDNSRHSQLFASPSGADQIKYAWVQGYIPPNNDVNNIPVASIVFNTSLVTAALKTQCQWCAFGQCAPCNYGEPGCACPSYNVTLVAGYNSTAYKRTVVNVSKGAKTVTVAINASLPNLLGTEQQYAADWLGFNNYFSFPGSASQFYGNKSVWLDPISNTINRFMLYWVQFDDGSAALYEGDIVAFDDSGFNMTFNWTRLNISYASVTGVSYGIHQYFCDIPAGYVDHSGTGHGNITVSHPVENIVVTLQRAKNLWVELKLKHGTAPVPNAICFTDSGSPPIQGSSGSGVCNITNLNQNADFNVTVTIPGSGIQTRARIRINDYYNSLGCGDGQSCMNFSGAYKLSWDVYQPSALVTVAVGDNSNAGPIPGASVYWNGILSGVTLSTGQTVFGVPWEFCVDENLSAQKFGFYNKSILVLLEKDAIYRISLVPLSEQASKEAAGAGALGSAAGVLGFVGNPTFLGIIVVALAAVGGAETGGLISGVFCAVVSSFLMMMMGYFPFAYFAVIFALSALLGAAGARDTLTGMIKGK